MKKLKKVGHVTVQGLVHALQQVFDVEGPEKDLSNVSDWFSGVPEGAVPYLNAFRLKYFEYDTHVELLDKFFQNHYVKRIGDLGCGVANHLVRLAKRGYSCVGIDQSEESLKLAANTAQKTGVKIALIEGNIRDIELDYQLDAVLSMYVPLPPTGIEKISLNARKFLKKGGFLIKVYGTPDPNGVPDQASIYDVDVIENKSFRVARLEHWWIKGNVISWNAYYFVRENIQGQTYSNKVLVFVDHNDMEAHRHFDQKQLEKEWKKRGYHIAALYPIPESRATPPWTRENLLILQKMD